MSYSLSRFAATEVRAEMARQRRTQTDLAVVLGRGQPTASRKLNGETAFTIDELHVIATWLDVSVLNFLSDTRAVA